MIRTCLLSSAVFLTFVSTVCTRDSSVARAAPPRWNDSPVIAYARVAPLDRLERDFAFLAESIDGSTTPKIRELFADLSRGVDPSRPSGAVVFLDEALVPMIFVPLRDEQLLLTDLRSKFGLESRRDGDGMYRLTHPDGDLDIAARSVGSWFYATGASNRDKLHDVPADPLPLLERIDPTLTAHVTVNVDQLPAAERTAILEEVTNAFSEGGNQTIAGQGGAVIEQLLLPVLAETKSIQFELECFRPLRQFHMSSRLTAVEGSALERWIDDASARAALFSGLPSRDAIFGAIGSLRLNSGMLRPLLEAWEPLAAKARESAPSPQSADDAERLLGRVVAQAVESVAATLHRGELDGGVVLERQGRDEVVLLAATTFTGARDLEEAAIELGTLLQQAPEFRALEWSMGASGDVGLHQIVVPMEDEDAVPLFGDPLRLAVGAGTDVLYAALGDDALKQLAEAIDRSRDDAPERGEVLRVFARLAPLLAALDKVPTEDAESDQLWREFAKQIAPFRKNDTIELSLRAHDKSLEGRLRVDMGIVRMLASQVPVGEEPESSHVAFDKIGILQLQRGEQFQLRFHTESETTTTIDATDRIDRGTHSLTYSFRVVQVDSDGMMHLETWLDRATIDKASPEGREVFDSANPPDPDRMTAEMILHKAIIGHPIIVKVQPDGTIAEITGIEEAVDAVVDTELNPSAAERDQARAFVARLLNEAGLRDSLTRGFEFYPGRPVVTGDRWRRTTENLTSINFLLDSRYQVKSLDAGGVAISVRSQVREPEPVEGAPVRWEVVGSGSGKITLDPRNGRLRLAESTMQLDAEATFEMDGATVSRPVVGVFTTTVGEPAAVERHVTASAGVTSGPATWLDLTVQDAKPNWQPSHRGRWRMDGGEIVAMGSRANERSYLTYAERTFSDFELTASIHYGRGTNGGVCFRASEEGLDGANPSGYEVQIHGLDTDRQPTGTIFKMPPDGKTAVVSLARPREAQPSRWFGLRIVAQGPKITVYIDDRKVAEHEDTSEPVLSGHIILQGPPQGTIRYKDLRIRPL